MFRHPIQVVEEADEFRRYGRELIFEYGRILYRHLVDTIELLESLFGGYLRASMGQHPKWDHAASLFDHEL